MTTYQTLFLLFILNLTNVFAWEINGPDSPSSTTLVLGDPSHTAEIVVDPQDYPVVRLAANLLSEDVHRVMGHRPTVQTGPPKGREIVLAGTLDHSAWIDQLDKAGKLSNLDSLRGRWEGTLCQMVNQPFPGVDRAFVIVGSDRRGTAYGLMRLSEKIGVSPWYWWADVPSPHQDELTIQSTGPDLDSPAVKYRGIFINDEDWGINAWARKTFDPALKNIGPKTYTKVFELMLRLRLNYLWPAMHPCSTEFGSIPENSALADQYAIVMGASHCEPLLRNNIWWPKELGAWRYDTNRDNMLTYWREGLQARGQYEAVWTMGMRGIHDQPMQGPPEIPARVAMLHQAILDQRDLLSKYVSPQWGPIAQCFIPYKEVLPLYNAGLQVPPDITLVWTDDNYGYLRRVGTPEEQKRPGGSGIYYHISYLGSPRSYTWIDTTPPALIWEEMRKAWDNQARTLWIINVGDIKPMEMGIDFLAHLAWNPDAFGPDSQPRFFEDFATRTFGIKTAPAVKSLLTEFYRLGQIHKPECMDRAWTSHLSVSDLQSLQTQYKHLLQEEKYSSSSLTPDWRDAWTELVGFPVRVLGATGLIFVDDQLALRGVETSSNEAGIAEERRYLQAEVDAYNQQIAGGKWRFMMPNGNLDADTDPKIRRQILWPWLDKPESDQKSPAIPSPSGRHVKAADFDRLVDQDGARWCAIEGLGYSGKAVALEPASAANQWDPADPNHSAPHLEYQFQTQSAAASLTIYFLPTYRLYPGMKLRVQLRVDNESSVLVEVPASSGSEDEGGPIRGPAVLSNRVRVTVPLPTLPAGPHTLYLQAVDPGLVIDELVLP